MRPLRAASRPERSSRGIGLGVAARHGLAHRVREGPPTRHRGKHEPQGAAHAALDAQHPIAALHELQERVDDRQPGPHRGLVADAAAPVPGRVEKPAVALARAREGLLVGEHEVEPVAEGRVQQVARLLGGHVHHHGTRDRVIRDEGEGRGGRSPVAAQRGQHRAAVLAPGEAQQPGPRDAFRLEHVARSVEEAHEPDRRRPVRRRELVGEGAAHPAEAEQHHVGARRLRRPAAADLRELEGGVDTPRRLGRVGRGDHERDVELGGALGDGDHVDAARGQGREHAGRDARSPRHPVAHDRDHAHPAARRHPVDEARRPALHERPS